MKKGIQQCKIQWNAIPNKGSIGQLNLNKM
jgi:hypothetical protein